MVWVAYMSTLIGPDGLFNREAGQREKNPA